MFDDCSFEIFCNYPARPKFRILGQNVYLHCREYIVTLRKWPTGIVVTQRRCENYAMERGYVSAICSSDCALHNGMCFPPITEDEYFRKVYWENYGVRDV